MSQVYSGAVALLGEKSTTMQIFIFSDIQVMSRSYVKIAYTIIASLAGIIGFSAACTLSPSAGWQYAYADNSCSVPSAILTVKRVIDTGNFYSSFLNERSSNGSYMNTPSTAQRAEYNAAFTGLINRLRYTQGKTSPSSLASALQGVVQEMRGRYKNQSLSTVERTKFAYLYYLTSAAIDALKGTTTYYDNNNSNNNNNNNDDALNKIKSYTTLNGKSYTIRRKSVYYVFSRGESTTINPYRRLPIMGDLINYLEYQNRLVLRAPNGRRYGVWKRNGSFKINRDNGSVINQIFNSYDTAKLMLDTCAVNTPVPRAYHHLCGFDTYGRE